MNNDFEKARKYGLVAPGFKGFMAYDDVNGNLVVDYDKTARMLAQDASITSVNVGIPSMFTTYIDPNVVKILFAKTAATELATEVQTGKWTDEHLTFPVVEYAGNVSGYSDFQDGPSVDSNYNFPVRDQFRFQSTIKIGDLEVAMASNAGLSLIAEKQKASASIQARFSNESYMRGVKNRAIYGLLDDPNLPDTISPISVGGKSTWRDKKESSPSTFTETIYADITKLISELQANNGANINNNTPMVLGISNAKNADLSVINSFGLTAETMLKKNFPNLEIVLVPELSDSVGETLYLAVPELNGTLTAQLSYSEKYRVGRMVPFTSHFEQKVAGTTFGAIIKRPCLIARMVGI